MVAEERITTKFTGLVAAHGSEEEATFLSTQQVDEARHMQFYARFRDEVIAEPQIDRRPRGARPRAGVGLVPRSSSTRRSCELHERARREPGRPGGQGPLRDALPPGAREHARPDDLQVRHRLPERRGAAARASSRATRRSTTTRRGTSATASGSCARPSASTPSSPTPCARRCDELLPSVAESLKPPGDGNGSDRPARRHAGGDPRVRARRADSAPQADRRTARDRVQLARCRT